jgi:hypothetical protein
MSARFEHQAGAYPIEFSEKMLAFLAHIFALQFGATLLYKSYGISAGMRVDAVEDVFHGFKNKALLTTNSSKLINELKSTLT